MSVAAEPPLLFFYGSLIHDALREAVAGEPSPARPARAPGWRVVADPDTSFPAMTPCDGAAEGVATAYPSAEAIRRLKLFEGADYALATIEVALDGARTQAACFLPAAGFAARLAARGALAPWRYADWARDSGPWVVQATEAWVRLAEAVGPAEADRIWPDLAGGASRAAAPRRLGQGFGAADVAADGVDRLYAGFRSLDCFRGRFRRFDGAMGATVEMLSLRSVRAAAVLPFDPARDAVLLIEQWRPGAWLHDADAGWQIELPAGAVDEAEGETAEAAARREALEEAGLRLGRLERAYAFLSAPAITDEHVTLFVGEADLAAYLSAERRGGLAAESEDIRTIALSLDAALEAAARGEITNSFALLGLNWLDRHRRRLAADWRSR